MNHDGTAPTMALFLDSNRSPTAIVSQWRLATGLVLFTYVLTHLLNHALGLASLAAMDYGSLWFHWLWHSHAGTFALYFSLLTHIGLALWALYVRRLSMSVIEAVRMVLGFTIPFLLLSHVTGTRIAFELFGQDDSYARLLLLFGYSQPETGIRQAVLLVVAWSHGCIGLFLWLRLKSWFPRSAPWLATASVLIPVLALLGYLNGVREVLRLAENPEWLEELRKSTMLAPEQRDVLVSVRDWIFNLFAGSIVFTLLVKTARKFAERRHKTVRIRYPNNRMVEVPTGYSVLEASRHGHVPHASVCGGRGRCSTCRVRISRGLDALPTPSADESLVLRRVGAPANVRLACQLRPTSDVSVIPLLPVTARPRDGYAQRDYLAGQEREICVLFADLRGFTRFSESKLPYDVVFFLNRYLETMSHAIEQAGGIPNQFTGDGIMALFGIEAGPIKGSREAIHAAKAMAAGLDELSASLSEELGEPLRMGIGIHTGRAVVGRMGGGVALYLTAVGDTVHVASRLQDLTKVYECQLIVSEAAAYSAGLNVASFERHEARIRNRGNPVAIRVVKSMHTIDTTFGGDN